MNDPGSIRTHNPSNRGAADRAATEIGFLPVFLLLFITNVPDQCSRFETPTGQKSTACLCLFQVRRITQSPLLYSSQHDALF